MLNLRTATQTKYKILQKAENLIILYITFYWFSQVYCRLTTNKPGKQETAQYWVKGVQFLLLFLGVNTFLSRLKRLNYTGEILDNSKNSHNNQIYWNIFLNWTLVNVKCTYRNNKAFKVIFRLKIYKTAFLGVWQLL